MSGTESVSTKRPTLKSQLFFKMPTIKLGGHMPLFIGLKKQTNKQHPWAAGCSGCTPSQQGFLAPSCQSSIDTVLCNRSMHASSRFSFSSFQSCPFSYYLSNMQNNCKSLYTAASPRRAFRLVFWPLCRHEGLVLLPLLSDTVTNVGVSNCPWGSSEPSI